jgi:hypothetical protein
MRQGKGRAAPWPPSQPFEAMARRAREGRTIPSCSSSRHSCASLRGSAEAEAEAGPPPSRIHAEPSGTTQDVQRNFIPATAANNTITAAARRPSGIINNRAAVIGIPVITRLPYIPAHIPQAQGIR